MPWHARSLYPIPPALLPAAAALAMLTAVCSAQNPVIEKFGKIPWQLDLIEDMGDDDRTAMYVIADRDHGTPGSHVFELLILDDGAGKLIILPIADSGPYAENIPAAPRQMLEILDRIASTRTSEISNRLEKVKGTLRSRLQPPGCGVPPGKQEEP